jgi:hypothetical protein
MNDEWPESDCIGAGLSNAYKLINLIVSLAEAVSTYPSFPQLQKPLPSVRKLSPRTT